MVVPSFPMLYTYVLQSIEKPPIRYTGLTASLVHFLVVISTIELTREVERVDHQHVEFQRRENALFGYRTGCRHFATK